MVKQPLNVLDFFYWKLIVVGRGDRSSLEELIKKEKSDPPPPIFSDNDNEALYVIIFSYYLNVCFKIKHKRGLPKDNCSHVMSVFLNRLGRPPINETVSQMSDIFSSLNS